MITELLAILSNYSLDLIERFGYFGLALVSLLENIFTPIPSEAVIPFAGVLVAQGRMNLFGVWFSSMSGTLVGSVIFYYVGYWLGVDRLYPLVARWGKYFFITTQDIQKSQSWFNRFGTFSVLLGRLIPQVRSFISIPAGMTRMPLLQFVLFTTIGSGIWTAFLMWLGIYFGENYTVFLPIFRKLDIVFVLLVMLAVGYFVYTRLSKKRSQRPTR